MLDSFATSLEASCERFSYFRNRYRYIRMRTLRFWNGQCSNHNFFSSSQLITMDSSGATFGTVTSDGYIFTYTLDKLFTGDVGMSTPIGRQQLVQWPSGLHAQAITTPGPASAASHLHEGHCFR